MNVIIPPASKVQARGVRFSDRSESLFHGTLSRHRYLILYISSLSLTCAGRGGKREKESAFERC